MSDQFYVPKNQKGVFANAAAWVIGILILVGLIVGAVFIIRTVTASPAGQAGAFRQKESAQNRLFAQANFEQLDADVRGYVAKVRIAKQALADDKAGAADPTQLGIDRTNVEGARQECVDAVQQYNADSRKYLLRDFKSAGLPATHQIGECLNA